MPLASRRSASALDARQECAGSAARGGGRAETVQARSDYCKRLRPCRPYRAVFGDPALGSVENFIPPPCGMYPPPPTQASVSGQHCMARRGGNAGSCCVFTHPAPSLVRYVTPPPSAFYPLQKRVSRSLAGRITGNAHPPHLQLYPPYRCAASYSTVHLSRACVAGALHTALQLPRTCVAATLYLRSRWHRIAAPLQRSAVQLRHSSGEGRAFRCWLVVAEHGPFEQRIS